MSGSTCSYLLPSSDRKVIGYTEATIKYIGLKTLHGNGRPLRCAKIYQERVSNVFCSPVAANNRKGQTIFMVSPQTFQLDIETKTQRRH
jgi:hypothetical protein